MTATTMMTRWQKYCMVVVEHWILIYEGQGSIPSTLNLVRPTLQEMLKAFGPFTCLVSGDRKNKLSYAGARKMQRSFIFVQSHVRIWCPHLWTIQCINVYCKRQGAAWLLNFSFLHEMALFQFNHCFRIIFRIILVLDEYCINSSIAIVPGRGDIARINQLTAISCEYSKTSRITIRTCSQLYV